MKQAKIFMYNHPVGTLTEDENGYTMSLLLACCKDCIGVRNALR